MALKKAGRTGFTLANHQEALAGLVGELPRLVYIHGPEDYLRQTALEVVRQRWQENWPDGETLTLYAGEGADALSLADLMGELAGGGLFTRHKLVILRNAHKFLFRTGARGGRESEAGVASVLLERLENLPAGISLLLESSASPPANQTLGKRLLALARSIPCPLVGPREIPAWLAARSRELGKSLETEAGRLLLETQGTSLGFLASELEKLALFVHDRPRISAEDVGEFLTGTVEFDVWGLRQAVEKREADSALAYARKITSQGQRGPDGERSDADKSSHLALAGLLGQIPDLLRAGTARAEKLSPEEYALRENAHPWRSSRSLAPWLAARQFTAAGRYQLRELRSFLTLACDGVKRSHDTGGDPRLELELLALQITRKPVHPRPPDRSGREGEQPSPDFLPG
ncbi:MAG: hypothetical protein LBU79_01980 [Planctomycetota bacterium]|jgi:DNA polymerase-3 subunit delta|nr:hypothetical protein [Planctomycetota bacterium]